MRWLEFLSPIELMTRRGRAAFSLRCRLFPISWGLVLAIALAPCSVFAQTMSAPPVQPTVESPIQPSPTEPQTAEETTPRMEPTFTPDWALTALQTSPLHIAPGDEAFHTGLAQWWLLVVALMVLAGAFVMEKARRNDKP